MTDVIVSRNCCCTLCKVVIIPQAKVLICVHSVVTYITHTDKVKKHYKDIHIFMYFNLYDKLAGQQY